MSAGGASRRDEQTLVLGGGEKKVAEILGIPYDEYSQVGLFPIAYTKGTEFKPADRIPPEHLSHWNGW